MGKFVVHDSAIINTRTGSATMINHNNDKTFAVVVKCGHCGNGYFIPIMFALKCENIDAAVDMARKLGRVKSDDKNCILAAGEISKLEYSFLSHINTHDKFLQNLATEDEILARRIVSSSKVDWKCKNARKVLPRSVKTADQYTENWALQRYFAPTMYGNELTYPTKINFRIMLDDYITQMAKLFGIKFKHSNILSLYYQIYGDNNPLGVQYKNDMLLYTYENGNKIKIKPSDAAKPYLDAFKKQEIEETVKKQEIEETVKATIPSAREKFASKYAKYQAVKDKNKPIK